ncbi:MAG: DUF5666 domain-containing protein [Dehalococcoidia bacterium]
MGQNFQSILNECVKELETGQSLDAILARYPEQADELRPLLLTVQVLKAMPRARPRADVQQAGWQRYLGEAIALRRVRQRQPALSLWRPLAAAAAALLLMVFLTGGATVYAASRSLPDSPLYPLKLATEEARLWFIFSEDDRADILLDQTETRMSEIRKLVQQGKPVKGNVLSALRARMTRATDIIDKRDAPPKLVARANELSARQEEILFAIGDNVATGDRDEYGKALMVIHEVRIELQGLSEPAPRLDPEALAQGVGSFTGLIVSRQDDAWVIGGEEVLVDERTIIEGDGGSVLGRLAQVTVSRGSDGLHALSISLRGSEDLARRATISGIIDRVEKDSIQVGGRTVLIGQHILRDGELRQGSKVAVIGEVGEGQTFVATLIRVAPVEGAEDTFVYEGTVQQVTSSQWQVGGRTFELDASTLIDAGSLLVEPGVRARVEGVRRGDELVAKQIVLLALEASPGTVTVEGVFQEQVDGSWVIAGVPIEFTPESPALITPPVGTLVRVSGNQVGQAMVVTTAESIRPPEEMGLVKLEGVVGQVDDQWHIGPAPFHTTAVTKIGGQLIPGARAVVWGLPSEDDSLTAIYVDVLDSQSLLAP